MNLAPPRLDDLDARALLEAARRRLRDTGAIWQAVDPADPGVALLEAVAQVAGEELIRLNRLPHALQTRFMTMLGASLRPGQADTAMLRFTLASPGNDATLLPAGLQIAAKGAPEVVFTLLEEIRVPAGEVVGEGMSARANRVFERVAGTGTGAPVQRLDLPHTALPDAPAAVASVDVLVRWATSPPTGADVVDRDGTSYVRYHESREASSAITGGHFAVDRAAGRITFPAQGHFVPPEGAQVLVSYHHVTSLARNANRASAPDTLTEPVEPLPGISVTNTAAATSGQAPETPEQRLGRGSVSLLAGDMAFRARDYEALALEAHPGVARAYAMSSAERRAFARPGTVRVLIAPHVPDDADGGVDLESMESVQVLPHAGQEMLVRVREHLTSACPLGVQVEVDWLQAKAVGVNCRAYVSPGADKEAIEIALRRKLGAFLCPIPGGDWPDGWPLGRPLRQSEVIETLLSVPGVRAVNRVRLLPRFPMVGPTTSLAVDAAQSGVWFVVMGGALYRTLDSGTGWTRTRIEAERISAVATHPVHTGLTAVATDAGEVLVSRDCGDRFEPFATAPFVPDQMLWADGAQTPRLLLAGEGDLSESAGPSDDGTVSMGRNLAAQDALVGPTWAIAAYPDGRGGRLVAAARRDMRGVVLSNDSGWDGSFVPVGLADHDVRALCFTQSEGVIWLLAGCARPVTRTRHALFGARVDPDVGEIDRWVPMDRGWVAGGVRCLASRGDAIFAGTSAHGLLLGRFADGGIEWQLASADSGLPVRADGRGPVGIGMVTCVPRRAGDEGACGETMVGGTDHLLLSSDNGVRFSEVAVRPGADRLSLPTDWTLCADRHEIEICDVDG